MIVGYIDHVKAHGGQGIRQLRWGVEQWVAVGGPGGDRPLLVDEGKVSGSDSLPYVAVHSVKGIGARPAVGGGERGGVAPGIRIDGTVNDVISHRKNGYLSPGAGGSAVSAEKKAKGDQYCK